MDDDILITLLFFYFLIAVGLFATLSGKNLIATIIVMIFFLVSMFFALISGIYSSLKLTFESAQGKVMALLTASVVLWILTAVITYSIYYSTNEVMPLFSEIFNLGGKLVFTLAMFMQFKIARITWSKMKVGMFWYSMILSVVAAAFFSINGITLQSLNVNASAFHFTRIIANMIIAINMVIVLFLASEFAGGKLFKSWLYIAIANVLFFFGNSLYATFVDSANQFDATRVFLTAYMLGFLMLGYGMMLQGLLASDALAQLKSQDKAGHYPE